MLTNDDKQWIRNEIKGSTADIREDVTELKSDVAVLKEDVAELKSEVAVLKKDVAELKSEVAVLKKDVAELKSEVAVLKADMAELKAEVKELNDNVVRTNVYLENTLGPLIQDLASCYTSATKIYIERTAEIDEMKVKLDACSSLTHENSVKIRCMEAAYAAKTINA